MSTQSEMPDRHEPTDGGSDSGLGTAGQIPVQPDPRASDSDPSEARDMVAEARDVIAQAREMLAHARDMVADAHDCMAEARDKTTEARDKALGIVDPGAAADRAEARRDRERAASDRALAAADRAAAQLDRTVSTAGRLAFSMDGLTGAYLRVPGFVELRREMARARRTQKPLVLAFVDVDGLKAVNDSRGHAAGDRMLVDVAATLVKQMRSYDLIIRYGGDEFICVLSGLDMAAATNRLSSLNAVLAETPQRGSVTVGLAEMQPDDLPDELLVRADMALYRKRRSHSNHGAPRAPEPSQTRDDALPEVWPIMR